MSFSRLAYDAQAYRTNLKQSSGPSSYVLGTPWHMCSPCLPEGGNASGDSRGAATCTTPSPIDVDSELLGITRRASRDPECMYKPGQSMNMCTNSTTVSDCPRTALSEDTRLSNPPCTLRSTGWNRWEWMCKNPQARALVPFDSMINSQLLAKDSHRPLIPSPIDPTNALPQDNDTMVAYEPCKGSELTNNLPIVSWRSCNELAAM